MRQGEVYVNGVFAGMITEGIDGCYSFVYDDGYYRDPSLPAISLTMPKSQKQFESPYLFPFFSNMLSEGSNRLVQAKLHHIDEDDDFGILLATAYLDTPGAVTVKNVENG